VTWQWIFPVTRFYVDGLTGQRRGHHLHESGLQRAVKAAVRAVGIHKPAGCHALRHSFATHHSVDPSLSGRPFRDRTGLENRGRRMRGGVRLQDIRAHVSHDTPQRRERSGLDKGIV
jgi:integrase